jgi:hypothetical protein
VLVDVDVLVEVLVDVLVEVEVVPLLELVAPPVPDEEDEPTGSSDSHCDTALQWKCFGQSSDESTQSTLQFPLSQ